MTNPRRKQVMAALASHHEKTYKTALPQPRRKKAKGTEPTEHEHQVAVCKWLTAKGLLFASVPNGAAYNQDDGAGYRQSAYLKAEGLKKGVPDLLVFTATKDACGVALEMKRDRKGKLRPEQSQWLKALEAEGWECIVGYGAEDAIEKLSRLYGGED